MQVGIAGAGAVAMAYAAYLINDGHTPCVWSPSGQRTASLAMGLSLRVTGMLEGEFQPRICPDAETLAQNEIIIIALPAYGYRAVFDALMPHLASRHTIIISGHLSFAALYLSKKLAERGIQIPIVVWSTTAMTAKAPNTPIEVRIGLLRKNVDIAVLPVSHAEKALEICSYLFGQRFTLKDDLLTLALSNLNPQNHLGVTLLNLTRIELGETWHQNSNITPAVGSFMLALDRERLAIAMAVGKLVHPLANNFEAMDDVSGAALSQAYQLQAERNNPLGPKDINTRYVLEDVPFGLIPTLMLAKLAGISAVMHQSGTDILSVCYGRDFAADNDLLPELDDLDLRTLGQLVVEGYPLSKKM